MVREVQVVRLGGELGGQGIDLLHERRHTTGLAQRTHGQRVRTDAARNLGIGETMLLAAQERTYKMGANHKQRVRCLFSIARPCVARCTFVFLTRRDILQRPAQEHLLHLLLNLNDVLELAQEPTGDKNKRETTVSSVPSMDSSALDLLAPGN
jgi:hypothetical protein